MFESLFGRGSKGAAALGVLAAGSVLTLAPEAWAVTYTTNMATPSSALPGWPPSSVYDGTVGTIWSSDTHPAPGATEWLAYWWSEGLQNTNFVRLLPRYAGGRALGFPVTFTVSYSSGTDWATVASYTGYPTPSRGDWIILPLPGTYLANGIQIVATTLGTDDVGNYVFQLDEAQGGYDAGFDQFTFVHNDLPALPGQNQIQGVGSGLFDPSKLGHWDFDDRGVVIDPNPGPHRNIYAPQAVLTGGGWNVYFGGWDGSSVQNDQISMTITTDNFNSFGAHRLVIGNGAYIHCNNDSVLQVADGDWRMVYTNYPTGLLNRPGYSTSTDGINWTPSSGDSAHLLTMTGYGNWPNADVNGGNTIFLDVDGTWHLYFIDFAPGTAGGVLHATSTDFINYAYQGQALANGVVPQDLKAFVFGGTTYYVGVYHANGANIWTSVSTNLSSLGPLIPTFVNEGTADRYIVAAGLVQDGARIYGVLYGAGPVSSLDQNRIFARWLQKKVVFQNRFVRWGDIEHGFGPDNVRLFLAAGDNVETGNFYVYDSDGTTLLYMSPEVTMRVGDVWTYAGP